MKHIWICQRILPSIMISSKEWAVEVLISRSEDLKRWVLVNIQSIQTIDNPTCCNIKKEMIAKIIFEVTSNTWTNQKKSFKQSSQVISKIKIETEENKSIITTSWIQVSYQTNNLLAERTSLVKLEKDKLSKERHTVRTVHLKAKLTWGMID